MKRNKGFSLIELMVVVAIIGILAAVAVPAYGNYVRKGKIAEAATQLSNLRVSMEQYYQDNRSYINPIGGTCGVAMPIAPVVQYFNLTCVGTATTYTLTATGTASMAGFTYTINEQNAKTSTITATGWTGNAVCWATKQDGTC